MQSVFHFPYTQKMFLLSQGAWVKVTAPDEFVCEMSKEIARMQSLYNPEESQIK